MTEQFNKKVIGDCTLYNADCVDVLSLISTVDAVVTDPPYGINQDKGFSGSSGFGGSGGKPIHRKKYFGVWDNVRPTKKIFDLILSYKKNCIIFGGNYFTDILPVGKHWLVWDKKNTMPTFSDCELAWTNINKKSVKLLTYEYNGVLGKREKRVHPTQKPYEVMRWCIEKLPKPNSIIFDPFMGSGTTGVACAKLGKKFIGVELDPNYFQIACQRIEKAYQEPDLFVSPPTEIKQEVMEL